MKNKGIIITLLLLTVLTPLVVLATKNIILDEEGRVIIYADETIPEELEPGTKITLAIPSQESKNEEDKLKLEKE